MIWLITGSSRGLGRSLAKVVLSAGHRVAATARSADRLSSLVERYGAQVKTISLDVTAAILYIAGLTEPPLRLLLGRDAYDGAEKNDLARLEAARQWKELSYSTDFRQDEDQSKLG